MKEGPNIATVASLIGDPARANILVALMAGKALTATELAVEAGITCQTASFHLSKLHDGGLLRLRKQGRRRYFSLANEQTAIVIEELTGLATISGHLRCNTGPKDAALRKARICYNHLAGSMGVILFDGLLTKNYLLQSNEGLKLSSPGKTFFENFGIDIDALHQKRAPMCRECLDWSERKSHLAGKLGRAFLSRIKDLDWAKQYQTTRVIKFTKDGEQKFLDLFS